jgi:hypothetical protein
MSFEVEEIEKKRGGLELSPKLLHVMNVDTHRLTM